MNDLFSKFLRQQKVISKFPSNAFLENVRCEGVRVIYPPIPVNLKKGTKTSD